MSYEQTARTNHRSLFDERYEILSIVGRGKSSVVYKARILDGATEDKLIALKVLTGHAKDPQHNIDRIKREAVAMLACRHDNVVRLNDYVASEDLCYIAMQYAERGDLSAELRRYKQPLSPTVALHLVHKLLLGLDAIHKAGIIHRDIKPENLLATKAGTLKIADFSIAHLPSANMSFVKNDLGAGTLDYLAPEYLESGIVSRQSDIYSVGVTLFQLLTKELPFEGDTLTTQIENKVAGRQISLSSFLDNPPPLLDSLIAKSVASSPEDRFQSAMEFRLAVEGFINGSWTPEKVSTQAQAVSAKGSIAKGRNLYEFQSESLEISSNLLSRARQTYQHSPPPAAEDLEADDIDDTPAQGFSEDLSRVAFPIPEQPKPRSIPKAAFGTFIALVFALASYLAYSQQSTASKPTGIKLASLSSPVFTDQALAAKPRIGAIYGLLDDNSEVTFSITELNDSSNLIVTLGIPGWVSPVVDAHSWKEEDGRVIVNSNGMSITLFKDDDISIAEGKQSGYYREKGSGRYGLWELW